MDTLSNIYIPFRIRIEPGGTKFTIPLPRNKIKDDYHFYFDWLTLTPDLYSKQAQILGYDPQQELDHQYSYQFQLEHNYGAEYYKTERNANKYIQDPKSETDNNTTLYEINDFFSGAKTVGAKWPPVVFDWILRQNLVTTRDPNQFNYNALRYLYNTTEDSPSFHDWLPPGSRMPGLNNWIFPVDPVDPQTLSNTIVRMHLAPNVEIGFSNDGLLKAFGFSENQYVPKSAPNAQIKFANPDPCKYLTIVAENPVGKMVPSVLNKITLYSHKKKVTSPFGELTTKRGNLVKLDQLAQDYNKGFSELAETCQHSLGLQYNAATKSFSFVYPATPNLTTDILIDPEVAEQIGYPRGTNKIVQGTEPSPIVWEKDITDYIKNAQTIVYDVGLATVYLENETSFQTVLFNQLVMANLEPSQDGTMKMKCSTGPDSPSAFVSYFGVPELDFRISRFSEAMDPVPLELPVGAYVSGQLIGKKYKSQPKLANSR